VRRLQRALHRTPHLNLKVDGVFGPKTLVAARAFQEGAALEPDSVVGSKTWQALPDGGPMPVLPEGSTGDVVRNLQRVLTEGAPGQWGVTPDGIDGDFGPRTVASVKAFQAWAKVGVDGVVGDQTWAVSLPEQGATLESQVGLGYVTSPSRRTFPRKGWAWAVCIGAIASLVAGLWLYTAQAPKMNIVAVEIEGHAQPWPLPAGTFSALAWDYPFILGYGVALWLGTTAARWVFWSPRAATLARLGRGMTVVVVVADLIENLCLTLALSGAGSSRSTFEARALDAAAIAATIKFTVLVPAAVLAVVGLVVTLGRLVSGRGTRNPWPVGRIVLPAATEDQSPVPLIPDAPEGGRRALVQTNVRRRRAALHDRLYRTLPPVPPSAVPEAPLSEALKPAPGEPRWRLAYAVPGITPEKLKRDHATGFCLSGGGIRSGSVAMGALQTLRSELRSADYLVSISGGGYTSGAFAQLLTDAGDRDRVRAPGRAIHDPAAAYMPGSAELDHVRRHSSYLATTATQMLVALAVLARGLLATLALLFAPAVALGVAAAWFYYSIPLGVFPLFRLPLQNAVLAVGLVAGLALLTWFLQIASASAFTNAGNVVTNAGQRAKRFSSRAFYVRFGQWTFRWSSRASVFLTRIAVIAAVIAVGIPMLVWACERLVGPANAGAGFGGSVGTVLLTYLASIASIGWRRRKTIQKVASAATGKGTGPTQKAAIPTGLLQLLLVIASVGVLCISWLMLLGMVAVGTATDLAAGRFSPPIAFGVVAVVVVAVVGGLCDETSLSLHPFYRRRLASAFATRAVALPGPEPESEPLQVAIPYDPRELTPLSRYGRAARTVGEFPEFIFAAAANLTGEDRTPPGLTAVSFTMSADWVGGPDVGWVHTATLEKACSPRLRRDVTVQAAVAISGAAFASAMGRFASWYQIVLAVSGARLGTWLPNPAFLGVIQAAQDEQGHVPDWTLPGLPRIRRGTYLLRELFNIHPAQERLLQVTDGGHYENLGIVELLRRRCTTIYCIDGGGDSPPTAAGLAEAMALAETELGVRIDLKNPFAAEPGAGRPLVPDSTLAALNSTLSKEPVITGTIHYPAASGLPEGSRTGVIYIARALLWPKMSYPLLSYAAQHPVFPHDSTGDQWFDDGQFTAYTQLGRELGAAVKRVRQRGVTSHDGHVEQNGRRAGGRSPGDETPGAVSRMAG
jgi:lysozyme family protein